MGLLIKCFPKVIHELGATVKVIGDEPDGTNINDRCGAIHLEQLQEAVRVHHADIGIALDGDADRSLFVCAQGHVIDGDHALAAFALDLHNRGLLKYNTVVGTVMSNFGFELAMQRAGITLLRTSVGDRYILEQMVANGYNLGGEQSGHLIFLDHNTSGDGLVSGVQMLELMKRTGKSLLELAQCMQAVPQILLGVQVKQKPDLHTVPEIQQAIRSGENAIEWNWAGTRSILGNRTTHSRHG